MVIIIQLEQEKYFIQELVVVVQQILKVVQICHIHGVNHIGFVINFLIVHLNQQECKIGQMVQDVYNQLNVYNVLVYIIVIQLMDILQEVNVIVLMNVLLKEVF